MCSICVLKVLVLLDASFLSTANADIRFIFGDVRNHPNRHHLPSLSECGEVMAEGIVNYVINGQSVSKGQLPWMALLFKYHMSSNKLTAYCGGAVISNRYVLTAAHCCAKQLISVQLGDVQLNSYSNFCNRTETNDLCKVPFGHYSIANFTMHDYDPVTYQNDICIVRLQRRIEFNYATQPICLPIDGRLAFIHQTNYTLAEVAGWGRTDPERNGMSMVLKSAKVPVIPLYRCQLYHRVTDQNICSGTPSTGACMGDSGGPLMYEYRVGNNAFRYFAIGIVSYGAAPVCVRGSPSVFTRVQFFVKWILDNVQP